MVSFGRKKNKIQIVLQARFGAEELSSSAL
jgi:hypothetical protein